MHYVQISNAIWILSLKFTGATMLKASNVVAPCSFEEYSERKSSWCYVDYQQAALRTETINTEGKWMEQVVCSESCMCRIQEQMTGSYGRWIRENSLDLFPPRSQSLSCFHFHHSQTLICFPCVSVFWTAIEVWMSMIEREKMIP
jgi:hypothetical protein